MESGNVLSGGVPLTPLHPSTHHPGAEEHQKVISGEGVSCGSFCRSVALTHFRHGMRGSLGAGGGNWSRWQAKREGTPGNYLPPPFTHGHHQTVSIKIILIMFFAADVPWKKSYVNLDSILLKSTDITSLTEIHIAKAVVLPVVMYTCENRIVKKAEHRRMDAFELWCWRRLLRVPFTARRSNQLILKEINLEHSLEGMMLKLKLHYFGHLMWRAD